MRRTCKCSHEREKMCVCACVCEFECMCVCVYVCVSACVSACVGVGVDATTIIRTTITRTTFGDNDTYQNKISTAPLRRTVNKLSHAILQTVILPSVVILNVLAPRECAGICR
jgi:hypothetical protein